MFRLNQSRVLVYLVLDLPQREDGGNALLDNPEKGALMMNTTLVYKYLDWEFMFRLNQSRVLVYLVDSAVPPPLSKTFLCASSSTNGF